VSDVLLGMKRNVIWVAATSTTLAAAITGTAESTITLTSAAATADATAVLPVRAEIDNERIHIVGSGTNPTVVRARDHSTAATHLTGATVKLLRPVRVPKTADWTPNLDMQDIAIPGDGTVEHIFRLQGLTGTLTFNRWDETVLSIAMGVTPVTTGVGLHSDIASLFHPQIGSYAVTEEWIELIALDGSNNDAEITERIIMWNCKFQKPFVPGAAGNNSLQGTPLNWSANPVTTDLFGRAIPGATEAIHYSIGKVA
jgi:hypothetical protein